MIHADCVRCRGFEDAFPIETTTKWILELGYSEVIIRTDGESSIVALSRRVGEKLRDNDNDTLREVPHWSDEGLALQARASGPWPHEKESVR